MSSASRVPSSHSPDVGEVESNGQLEVQLDGSALMQPANSVLDFYINLQSK